MARRTTEIVWLGLFLLSVAYTAGRQSTVTDATEDTVSEVA